MKLRNDNAADRKFANKLIAILADLTSTGKLEWTVSDDRTRFGTAVGAWIVSIEGSTIKLHNGWKGQYSSAEHDLSATQTGRLLNLLVTVPGAVEADQDLRKQWDNRVDVDAVLKAAGIALDPCPA